MATDAYQDDYVTPAAPGGRPPLAIAVAAIETDAFEEEEPERAEGAIGYGSLLSLGSSIRKKKPLIVIDPVEAENEVRRVQFVAAQQLVDPDEADGIEFREAPVAFTDPCVAPETDEPELGAAEALADEAQDELVLIDPEPELDLPSSIEAGAEMGEADNGALSVALAEPATISQACGVELDPAAADLEPPAALHGHSLRARMPAQAPRRSLGDHALALLAWLRDRLMRLR